jgi:3-oxoacyl-(acyl-carrier-protein) synthase
MPHLLPLLRRPHPLSRIPAHRLLLPFSTCSGLTNRDQTAGVAALTTVGDAADAIVVGDARVAGAIGGQAAICRLQNMLRRGLLIHARVNLSRTSRPRLTISR